MSIEILDGFDRYEAFNFYQKNSENFGDSSSSLLAMNVRGPDHVEVEGGYNDREGGYVKATASWDFDNSERTSNDKNSGRDTEASKERDSKDDNEKRISQNHHFKIWV